MRSFYAVVGAAGPGPNLGMVLERTGLGSGGSHFAGRLIQAPWAPHPRRASHAPPHRFPSQHPDAFQGNLSRRKWGSQVKASVFSWTDDCQRVRERLRHFLEGGWKNFVATRYHQLRRGSVRELGAAQHPL